MPFPRPVLLTLGLYPIVVYAWLHAWDRDPLYLATFDDIFRIQHAWEAANGALFPTELWPPLPFWIAALPLRLWPDGRVVPQLLGVLASTGALAGLAGIASSLGLSVPAVCAAVLLAGCLPWFLYLAPSALAEPYAHAFLLFALWNVLRVERGEARLTHAALGIAAAGMCRYEAWTAALLFSAWAWRRGARPPALLVWAFPAAWMALQLAWTGNPVEFGAEAVRALRTDFGPFGWFVLLPEDLWSTLGPVAALALGGATLLRGTPGARTVAFAGGVYFAAILLAFSTGLVGVHNTPRHLVLPTMLLALPAAALIDRVRGISTLAAAGVFVAALQVELLTESTPPDGVDNHVAVLGHRIRSMRAAREIPSGGTLLIEASPMDCFSLRIASGDLSLGLFDRDATRVPTDRKLTRAEEAENPSVFEMPRPRLEAWLREKRVGAILAHDPDHANLAASFGRRVDFQGGWVLVQVKP